MSVSIVPQAKSLCFSDEQRQMIREKYAPGASESDFAVLLAIAQARNLNPLLGQIHFVLRWDSNRNAQVWAVQVAIDGLRAIAQRTGQYAGQDEPEFVEVNGKLVACKVKVYRKDWGDRACVGVAYFAEYCAYRKDGALTHFWAVKPHIMLAKCAEALALRKAFPEDTSGLYCAEEMDTGQVPGPTPRLDPKSSQKPTSSIPGASPGILAAIELTKTREGLAGLAKSIGALPEGSAKQAARLALGKRTSQLRAAR
jgi:phage recombination protein Bet